MQKQVAVGRQAVHSLVVVAVGKQVVVGEAVGSLVVVAVGKQVVVEEAVGRPVVVGEAVGRQAVA